MDMTITTTPGVNIILWTTARAPLLALILFDEIPFSFDWTITISNVVSFFRAHGLI